MLTLALALVGSYLLGSIPFGYLAGRIRGIDIRKAGSGNIGATNVVRVLGKAYGYPVFVLDFLKGLGAVRISIAIATSVRPESTSPEVVGILAAVSAVIGHSFPLWLKFRGGKGVATSAGALFGLIDRKSTRLNSSHSQISYAVFCLKKKTNQLCGLAL